ncbi:hypothetical protein KAM546c_41990 [Enterobacter roggenkampii]|nr:hypothetical protein KAM546c_41990 [Enterobacter roggenkampii]
MNTRAGSAYVHGTASYIRTLILTGASTGSGALSHSGHLAGGDLIPRGDKNAALAELLPRAAVT